MRKADRLLIRRVVEDDAGPVSAILDEIILEGRHSLLAEPFGEPREREFIRSFPERGVFNVAALPQAGIVGFQAIEPYEPHMLAHQHVATMGTWVREGYRRRGIAAQLTRAGFSQARERGFKKVFTDIRADNPDSLLFHEAMGFVVVGVARRHAHFGNRYVDVIFVETSL